VVTLTPEEFSYGFVNTFSADDAAAAYERLTPAGLAATLEASNGGRLAHA